MAWLTSSWRHTTIAATRWTWRWRLVKRWERTCSKLTSFMTSWSLRRSKRLKLTRWASGHVWSRDQHCHSLTRFTAYTFARWSSWFVFVHVHVDLATAWRYRRSAGLVDWHISSDVCGGKPTLVMIQSLFYCTCTPSCTWLSFRNVHVADFDFRCNTVCHLDMTSTAFRVLCSWYSSWLSSSRSAFANRRRSTRRTHKRLVVTLKQPDMALRAVEVHLSQPCQSRQ